MENPVFLSIVFVFAATLFGLMFVNTDMSFVDVSRESSQRLISARQLLNEGNYAAAEAMIECALAANPPDLVRLEFLRMLSRCRVFRGALDEALEVLDQGAVLAESLANDEELTSINVEKCTLAMRTGRNLDALILATNSLDTINGKGPEFRLNVVAPLYFNLAVLHTVREEYWSASVCVAAAARIWREHPNAAESRENLARAEHLEKLIVKVTGSEE